MPRSAWDPLDTQDEYDVLHTLEETAVQINVRRNRMHTFNQWARREGVTRPDQIDWNTWLRFDLWLQENYGEIYRTHVVRETKRWLTWAHEQGHRGPVDFGDPLTQTVIEQLCRSHRARVFKGLDDRPYDFQMREAILGLVFGEGYNPDDLHQIKINDYNPRQHTLNKRRLDPRAEILIQRHLGFRMRKKGDHPELFLDGSGKPVGRQHIRRSLNVHLKRFMPEERKRMPVWAPHPERDRELVLTILTQRPRPVGTARPRTTDAGPLLRRLTAQTQQREPTWQANEPPRPSSP